MESKTPVRNHSFPTRIQSEGSCRVSAQNFCEGVDTNGMEWNGMEWSGVEWSGVDVLCVLRIAKLYIFSIQSFRMLSTRCK